MQNLLRTSVAVFTLLAAGLVCGTALADSPPEETFFETEVRPLLARRCFECHGEKKQEADIRLDRRQTVLGDNSAEAAVVPGKLADSRLWQVVQYDEADTQMPPEGKLPQAELDVLKAWIEYGAFWPDEPVPQEDSSTPRHADGTIDFARAAASHWAFRPIESPKIPVVAGGTPETAIDSFLLSPLQAAGLDFSSPATRETLIRRVWIDLLGVPPSYADVRKFVEDGRPDAVERLIDSCLNSPLYGQRWGRHWLDVARYADTKGYVFTQNRFYPYSYTYRDYVIRSLNEDLPYDQFLLDQLAADQLAESENDPRLAALGFLTVGPRFLNDAQNIIDDRIDVVTRGLMGLTVGCARCHDHKYDPIPTADYYALYGVFNSCEEPANPPLVGQLDESDPGYQSYSDELQKREQALAEFISTSHENLLRYATDRAADYIPAAAQALQLVAADAVPAPAEPLRRKLIEHWKNVISQRAQAGHPAFLAWKRLMELPEADLKDHAEDTLRSLMLDPALGATWKAAFAASPPHSRVDVARTYGAVFGSVITEWNALRAADAGVSALPDPERDSIRSILFGPGSLSDVPSGENCPLFERDQHEALRNLHAKIDEWKATSPNAPPRAMVLRDRAEPVQQVVFLRGDIHRRGPEVTRHLPRILDTAGAHEFQKGSGRLELARQIVASDNPLTARVIVNRVWSYHFGTGLVSTASDFGLRGEEPTHPQLLDYLAWTFIHEDRWSLKSLHRRILLSRAWQQASDDRPQGRAIDPENRLLWRQNRQRLDFETMRDSMLAAAGALDTSLNGRPVNIESQPFSHRRSVYALIDRNNPSGLLRTFDFPSADTSSAGRPLTTVPQQALYSMNSPFARMVAAAVAQRVEGLGDDRRAQAERLIEIVFARDPRAEELEQLAGFLAKHPVHELAQGLLMSNEFLFVD